MDNPAAPAASLNVEQLLHLHTLTKDVAKVFQKQLRAYLDTLALLFPPLRLFVLRSCLMLLHFTKSAAIAELLAGLRYRVEVRQAPETGDLPLVTISAPFSTMRPPDSLVTVASGLAGGTSFSEVLDLATVQSLKDPLREQISAVLRSH